MLVDIAQMLKIKIPSDWLHLKLVQTDGYNPGFSFQQLLLVMYIQPVYKNTGIRITVYFISLLHTPF